MKTNEEKSESGLIPNPLLDGLPVAEIVEGKIEPFSELEMIENGLSNLLERMVAYNEKNPVNGTGTAISKLKQAILFFNKEY